jgi:hypothetical protein
VVPQVVIESEQARHAASSEAQLVSIQVDDEPVGQLSSPHVLRQSYSDWQPPVLTRHARRLLSAQFQQSGFTSAIRQLSTHAPSLHPSVHVAVDAAQYDIVTWLIGNERHAARHAALAAQSESAQSVAPSTSLSRRSSQIVSVEGAVRTQVPDRHSSPRPHGGVHVVGPASISTMRPLSREPASSVRTGPESTGPGPPPPARRRPHPVETTTATATTIATKTKEVRLMIRLQAPGPGVWHLVGGAQPTPERGGDGPTAQERPASGAVSAQRLGSV